MHNPNDKADKDQCIKKTNYRDFYDDEMRDIIARRYATDIEFFDYKFWLLFLIKVFWQYKQLHNDVK